MYLELIPCLNEQCVGHYRNRKPLIVFEQLKSSYLAVLQENSHSSTICMWSETKNLIGF